MQQDFVSIADIVESTGMSRGTVHNHLKAGRLPSLKLGRRRLIRRKAFDAWVAEAEAREEHNNGKGAA